MQLETREHYVIRIIHFYLEFGHAKWDTQKLMLSIWLIGVSCYRDILYINRFDLLSIAERGRNSLICTCFCR